MKNRNIIILVFILLQRLCFICDLSGEQLSPLVYKANMDKNLGGIGLDGLPVVRFVLLDKDLYNIPGLNYMIIHDVEVDAWGKAHSVWQFTGIKSSLVPFGREFLRWQPIFGPERMFEHRRESEKSFHFEDVEVHRFDSNMYKISTPDGFVSVYKDGHLIGFEHPLVGNLDCRMNGVWLLDAKWSDEEIFIKVIYNAKGRPLEYQMSNGQTCKFVWNGDGQLDSLTRASGETVNFEYKNGLLSEIKRSSMPDVQILEWSENIGYGLGNSLWPAPVHLDCDGDSRYDYDITSRGFVISRKLIDSGLKVVTLYNPKKNRIEQRIGSESIIFTLKRIGTKNNRLILVENGEGKILADYR